MPLRNWSALLAFVATIMLVIAGGPTVARAAACDPCPPDCPMMTSAAANSATADDHGKAPAQGEKPAKPPCVQAGICQASAAPPMPLASLDIGYLPVAAARHAVVSDRAAPSRPPDETLRPPIHL